VEHLAARTWLPDELPAPVLLKALHAAGALWAAPDTEGRDGRFVSGLPHDEVLALLRDHGRLAR
jgi:hypothetical protein